MGTPATFGRSKLYVSPSSNNSYATAPTEAYYYASSSVGKRGTVVFADGTDGTRGDPGEMTRQGIYMVGGQLSLYPPGPWLEKWLPRILGDETTTGSGTVGSPFSFPLGELLPEFYLTQDLGSKVHHYTGCKVSRAIFTLAPGMAMRLDLAIEGLDEVVAAAASVTTPPDIDFTHRPFVLADSTVTIASYARRVASVRIVIDNRLKTDRHLNSLKRTGLPELGRSVGVSIALPYESGTGTGGNTDLYDLLWSGTAVTVALQQSYESHQRLTFTMPSVQIPTEGVAPATRDEIGLTLNGVARTLIVSDVRQPEIAITLSTSAS
jgi:hypothetical protein